MTVELGVLSMRIGELLRLQMWDVMTECVVTRTDLSLYHELSLHIL